jgi:hypothetical protein
MIAEGCKRMGMKRDKDVRGRERKGTAEGCKRMGTIRDSGRMKEDRNEKE